MNEQSDGMAENGSHNRLIQQILTMNKVKNVFAYGWQCVCVSVSVCECVEGFTAAAQLVKRLLLTKLREKVRVKTFSGYKSLT